MNVAQVAHQCRSGRLTSCGGAHGVCAYELQPSLSGVVSLLSAMNRTMPLLAAVVAY